MTWQPVGANPVTGEMPPVVADWVRAQVSGAASGAVVLPQLAAAGTWTFANPFGRGCVVDVFVAGQKCGADVTVTPSTIVVVFPTPTSGYVVAV